MKHRQTITILCVIALAVACAIVAGYKLSAAWHTATNASQLPLSPCNLSVQECSVLLPQGAQLTLSIDPRPIRAMQKLSIQVDISGNGLDPRKVEIDFDGVDMNMGYNRPTLSGGSRHFSGQTILPICITGTMTWKATVLITTDHKKIAIPFQFSVAGQ